MAKKGRKVSKGFKPHGDNVAVEVIGKGERTETGLYVKPREHPFYCKGKVISIGPGILNEKGKIYPAEFKEGDYIIYDKRQGVEVYMGYALVKVQSIIAIVDKDTDIS
ncbi:MAG: co-chaperone GroES [Proteobacteria bacterium]|nr:co-chaperone GroES [Pseudomonadota bacterium]